MDRAHWERQLGEAYYGLGQLAESAAHIERAVALLGWPAPGAGWRVPASLAGQIIRQALHRVRGAARLMERAPDERQVWMEAAQGYNRLAEIAGLRHALGPAIDSCLRTVNLAEHLGPAAETAQGYATLAYAANLLSPALTARYLRLAQDTARLAGNRAAQGWVAEMTGICNICTGQWATATAALEEAEAIYARLGDRRQHAEARAAHIFVAYRTGALAEAAAAGAELYSYARQQNDLQGQIVSLLMRAETALLQGHNEAVRAWTETAIALMGGNEEIRRGHAIWAGGMLALALLRLGEPERAAQTATEVVAWVPRWRFNQPWTLGGHPAVAEVCLALAATGHSAGHPAAWIGAAREVCRVMRTNARPYAFHRPLVGINAGLLAWQAGHPAAARTAWRQSLQAAHRMGLPHEQARAHYEIGRHLSPAHPARARHLARACDVFRHLGAAYDLEQAQAAAAEK